MITRSFHPIGQGAFYTERFRKINIVYDCGTLSNRDMADNLVKQSFESTDDIDILFISHFHDDHINKIETLKKHCNSIKNVVLPLLNDNNKILINIYKALDLQEEAILLESPNSLFDEQTNIIWVEPPKYSQKEKDINNKSINIEEIEKNRTITSEIKIKSSDDKNWCFMPHNYEYHERRKELVKKLEDNKLDVKEIENNLNYALDERENIKKTYDSLKGKINLNSMLLYSGPLNPKNNRTLLSFRWNFLLNYYYYMPYYMVNDLSRVGCIYTGDTDFNKVKIKKIFKNYWNCIGTIQIPHHGSIKNCNIDFLDGKFYFCPISVGNINSHVHPSPKVTRFISSNNSLPIVIDQSSCFGFIQTILD